MSAEILRRTAALMRERAEASRTAFGYGPWRVDGLDEYGHYVVVPTIQMGLGSRVAADLCEEDAEHIASWHPDVALEVANLLEVIAEDVGTSSLTFHAALALARAYLGSDA